MVRNPSNSSPELLSHCAKLFENVGQVSVIVYLFFVELYRRLLMMLFSD